ncbi:hypothetical protein, partial [Candidatus Thiosymbion oneisti]|uniref:hypothetical protein n=1 Tax=Candidatus Thiosymbion oneisti TaxID=589554 RepID=UPI001C408863
FPTKIKNLVNPENPVNPVRLELCNEYPELDHYMLSTTLNAKVRAEDGSWRILSSGTWQSPSTGWDEYL